MSKAVKRESVRCGAPANNQSRVREDHREQEATYLQYMGGVRLLWGAHAHAYHMWQVGVQHMGVRW